MGVSDLVEEKNAGDERYRVTKNGYKVVDFIFFRGFEKLLERVKVGSVVALINPQMFPNYKGDTLCFTIKKKHQFLHLGPAQYFQICTQDFCFEFFNKKTSPSETKKCSFHHTTKKSKKKKRTRHKNMQVVFNKKSRKSSKHPRKRSKKSHQKQAPSPPLPTFSWEIDSPPSPHLPIQRHQVSKPILVPK